MAEIPGTKPTLELPDWALDQIVRAEGSDVTNPNYHVITPTEVYRKTGWPEGAPIRQYMNWFQRVVSDYLRWLTGNAVRTFDTLESAVAATSAGDSFRLIGSDGTVRPGSTAAYISAIAGTDVRAVAVDGQAVYCASSSKVQRRARSVTGSATWEVTTVGTVVAIAVVRGFVVVAQTAGRVSTYNATTGALVEHVIVAGGSPPDCVDIAACGEHWVALYNDDSIRLHTINSSGVSTGVSGWPVTTAQSGATCIAMTGELVLVGAGQTVESYNHAAANHWSIASLVGVVYDIATDGELLIVGSDNAGDGMTIHAYPLAYDLGITPTRLWASAEADFGVVAVDERYTYASTGSFVYCYEKRSGALVWARDMEDGASAGTVITDMAGDCDAVLVGHSRTVGFGSLTRLARHAPTRIWTRHAPTAAYTRPINLLATPSDG